MARKPKGSHRAYKEWAPSVELLQQNINRIIDAIINGRAIVNLKVYQIVVLIIVRLKKSERKNTEKKNENEKQRVMKNR